MIGKRLRVRSLKVIDEQCRKKSCGVIPSSTELAANALCAFSRCQDSTHHVL
jgi:hypothetical protein